MITNCTGCQRAYDDPSEESANEPERYCPECWSNMFLDGEQANDHNRRTLREHRGKWANNPFPLGTMAFRRWNAGYQYRDMVNDG